MGDHTRRIYSYLRRPPSLVGRILLILAAASLVVAAFLPLWKIRLVAPQYQEGLSLQIDAYILIAGIKGQDLYVINNLNHYIGMKPIEAADFIEMRWVPFALGVFVLLALRAAAIGILRGVVDLLVLFLYFTAFSFGSFYYRLYTYGPQLDPKAPMTIQAFTPVLVGRQQIANFEQSSFPDTGTIFLTLFPLLLIASMWFSRKEQV
jgi:hypothetical protein